MVGMENQSKLELYMSVRALMCDSHGFGSKKEQRVVCGKWPAQHPALLCNNCGFGSSRGQCCVCEQWPAPNPAMVYDEHNRKCAKCGSYV